MTLSQVITMLAGLLLDKFGPYIAQVIEALLKRLIPGADKIEIATGSFADFVDQLTKILRDAANRMRFPFNRIMNWVIDYALNELWNSLLRSNVITGEAQPVLMKSANDVGEMVMSSFTPEELDQLCFEPVPEASKAVFHT